MNKLGFTILACFSLLLLTLGQCFAMEITKHTDPKTGLIYDTITNPVYPETRFRISYYAWQCGTPGTCIQASRGDSVHPCWNGCGFYTNEEGICKALGYEAAVPKTAKSTEGSNSAHRIQVNEHGNVSGAVAGRSLSSISCIGTRDPKPKEEIFEIKNPKFPGTDYRFTKPEEVPPYTCGAKAEDASDVNAVCRILGHERGVLLSPLYDDCGDYLRGKQVDSNGKVIGLKQTFVIDELLCID